MGPGLTVDRRLSAGGFERLPRGGSWSPVHGPGPWARFMGPGHGPGSWARFMGPVDGPSPWAESMGRVHGPSPGPGPGAQHRGQVHRAGRLTGPGRGCHAKGDFTRGPASMGGQQTRIVGNPCRRKEVRAHGQRPQVAEASGCGGPEGPPRLEEPDSRSSLIRGGSSFLAPGPYAASDNVRSVARHYTWPPGDPGQDPAHPPRGSNKGTKTPDPAVQAP